MIMAATKLKRAIRVALWAADPHCWYCGCELALAETTADHLVPRRRGGATAADNLVIACERCNQSKGAWPLARIACLVPRGAGLVTFRRARVLIVGERNP